MGNQPFTVFEDPFFKPFMDAVNPAYKLPSRKMLAGPLLDSVYSQIKGRSDEMIRTTSRFINVSTDESSNIKGSRICNISVHSEYGSMHYVSEDIFAKVMTALAEAEWLRNHLIVLSNNDLSRINCIANDTCSTMLSMWAEVEKFEDLRHCFFIPCDSHGIQLLVKDVFKIPRFKTILEKAQSIVVAFKRANLQYARLRKCQIICYKKLQSLVLSVITRWGTQFDLIKSVLINKDALKLYAFEYGELPAAKRLKQSVLDVIGDNGFWVELELMREFLKPINEYLKMSESGKSHLGHVLHRWKDIFKHLEIKKREFNEVNTFLSDGIFAQRYNRQVLDIHIVAYYLMPQTTLRDIQNVDFQARAIPINFEQQIGKFFRRYSSSEEDAQVLIREFFCFRSQVHPFEPTRLCWAQADEPVKFWDAAVGLTKFLGRIAVRLYSCPVNSVASERAFSVQNLIHTKTRNRLQSKTADKLAYIYTNGRVIYRVDGKLPLEGLLSKSVKQLTPQEEVQLESIMLDMTEDSIMEESIGMDNPESEIDDDEDEDELQEYDEISF